MPTKSSASVTRSRAYWSLRLNAAADGITSAGNHLTMHPTASKSGGGFFFACLPTRRAFESVGRAIAEVAQRPKQGQRAARVGKEKAPRRTLVNQIGYFVMSAATSIPSSVNRNRSTSLPLSAAYSARKGRSHNAVNPGQFSNAAAR